MIIYIHQHTDTMSWFLNGSDPSLQLDGYFGVTGVSADALAQYADWGGVSQGGGDEQGYYAHLDTIEHIRVGYLLFGDGLGRHTAYQGGAYREGLLSGWLKVLGEPLMIHQILENEAFEIITIFFEYIFKTMWQSFTKGP